MMCVDGYQTTFDRKHHVRVLTYIIPTGNWVSCSALESVGDFTFSLSPWLSLLTETKH